MKKCNGTGLVLKRCETKNNVWKRYGLSIQNSIGNYIEITKIKPNSASLNNGLKCRNPVSMRVFGICFIKWRWLGVICGGSNELDALFNVIYFMYPNGRKMLWQYM